MRTTRLEVPPRRDFFYSGWKQNSCSRIKSPPTPATLTILKIIPAVTLAFLPPALGDRIAHRTYGRALETWKGEPLTSSAIDIWAKRVARPVVNEWYMSDNYHHDSGEGCDDYSAGASRGDG